MFKTLLSCSLIESNEVIEDCDGETTEETPAADTQQEMADEKLKIESTQENSGAQSSSKKKKKKRKLNEAGEPTNVCEFFLRAHNPVCGGD